MYLTICC